MSDADTTDFEAANFEAVDFFTDPSIVDDPYPYFESLRAQCPVQREPHHGTFAVTGFDEAVEVLNDPITFSACNVVGGPFCPLPVPEGADDVSDLIEELRGTMPLAEVFATFDPPRHTDHRALLMRLITPKRLKENEDFMWRLIDRQLDEVVGKTECEFVGEVANPYTLLVVANLLGVPEEDHEQFRAGMGAQRPGSLEGDLVPANPFVFLQEAFTEYVEDRRRSPRDDVLSGLANATFPDGSSPSVADVVSLAGFLFVAGQETTVRLLAAMVQRLGEDPDLQQRLRDERDRIPAFAEEMLRFESPIKSHFRMARVTTEVAGVEVPAGATVMILDGAANRDPRRFDHPDEFDIDRPNVRQHLAFGQGVHTCPGAPLARAEARIALERILDRMADIRISEAHHGPADARRYEYLPTYLFRGLANLHIEYAPVGE